MKNRQPAGYDWGSTRGGRLLETVVLVFDSGNELVIHVMRARPDLVDLLP
jgi:hypothetical protein